jgi:hypothetical protein
LEVGSWKLEEMLMDPNPKQLRRLLYALTELESRLRSSGRIVAAANVGAVARCASGASHEAFLDDCREILEALLLGERDLGVDLIGPILDAVAMIDAGFSDSPPIQIEFA